MSNYSFTIYSLSAAKFSPSGIASQYSSGDQWDWNYWSKPTMTTDSDAAAQATTVSVSDTDSDPTHLNDDSGKSQVLSDDLTLNGVTYKAGSTIEDEYEVTLTGSDGTSYRMVAISINNRIVGYTWEGAAPPDGAKLSYLTQNNHGDYQTLDPNNVPSAPCFVAGTLLATPKGPRAIETLVPGDLILTAEHGFQPARWIGSRRIDAATLAAAPQLRPIRIAAGALGCGLPTTDLLVSPQHRLLVRSPVARRMTGEAEVLAAAKSFVGLPGVSVAEDVAETTYFHILFDAHEIVFANGARAESLYNGKELPRLLDPEARRELLTLFPEIFATPMAPARILLSGRLGRRLAERLLRNGKTVFTETETKPKDTPQKSA